MELQTEEVLKRLLPAFKDFECKNPGKANWYFELTHKTIPGAAIHVNLTHAKAKYIFSGVWPRFKGYHYCPNDAPSVKVSTDRTPDAIYTDVKRRLLDYYYHMLPKQQQLAREEEERETAKKQAMQNFNTFLDGQPFSEERRIPEGTDFHPYRHGVSLLRFTHDGSTVAITTNSLPLDIATEVLAVLKKRMPHKAS